MFQAIPTPPKPSYSVNVYGMTQAANNKTPPAQSVLDCAGGSVLYFTQGIVQTASGSMGL